MAKSLKKILSGIITAGLTVVMTTQVLAVEFKDTKGHWAEPAIQKWSEYGVIQGYAGEFLPEKPITRAEFATIIDNVMKFTQSSPNNFVDIPEGEWYTSQILKLHAAGIMFPDTSGKFLPNQPLARWEEFIMIAKAFKIEPIEGTTIFLDDATIPNEAKGYVKALQVNGLLAGYPVSGGYECRPYNTITKAELIKTVDNLTKALINTPGTHSVDYTGNIVVNTSGAVLNGMTIQGNLYLAEGIGEGDVTLNNVNVTGNVYINGGGTNSIYINDSIIDGVYISKANSQIRIVVSGKSSISVMTLKSGATIDTTNINAGSINSINIPADDSQRRLITLEGKFPQILVDGTGTDITSLGGAEIDALAANVNASVSGYVTVNRLYANKSTAIQTDAFVNIVSQYAAKTVNVGAQNGTLASGFQSAATFEVSTTGISEGTSITVKETNAAGVETTTQGLSFYTKNITANRSTITAITTSVVSTGTYYFKVTVDGVTSGLVTVNVAVQSKQIILEAQDGILIEGIAGTADFTAVTTSISNGKTVTVTETSSSGTVRTQTPGLTFTATNVSVNSTLIAARTTSDVKAGTYYFTVTADGVTSGVAKLVVTEQNKKAEIGEQTDVLTAGSAGTTTYTVTTRNIENGRRVYADETNSSGIIKTITTTGLILTASDIYNNRSTITVKTTGIVAEGTYYFTVSIDEITSAVAKIVIGTEGISVGVQLDQIFEGIPGTSQFNVTTKNMTNYLRVYITETTSKGVAKSKTPGLSFSGTDLYANKSTVTATTTSTVPEGIYYFTVTIDDITSDVQELYVNTATNKLITVGAQSDILTNGKSGNTTFSVTTRNMVNNLGVYVTETTSNGVAKSNTLGLSFYADNLYSNESTVIASITSAVPSGTYYFKVTIDNVSSEVKALYVGDSYAKYSISYHGNGSDGGSVPIDTYSYYAGDWVYVLDNTNLSRAFYTFDGWNTMPSGNGTQYYIGDRFRVAENVILYAQWRPNSMGSLNVQLSGDHAYAAGATHFFLSNKSDISHIVLGMKASELGYLFNAGNSLNIANNNGYYVIAIQTDNNGYVIAKGVSSQISR